MCYSRFGTLESAFIPKAFEAGISGPKYGDTSAILQHNTNSTPEGILKEKTVHSKFIQRGGDC